MESKMMGLAGGGFRIALGLCSCGRLDCVGVGAGVIGRRPG